MTYEDDFHLSSNLEGRLAVVGYSDRFGLHAFPAFSLWFARPPEFVETPEQRAMAAGLPVLAWIEARRLWPQLAPQHDPLTPPSMPQRC